MGPSADLATFQAFATALLLGALIGIEREKRKAEDGPGSLGGLRTSILFALLGALGGWLAKALAQPVLLVAVLAAAVLLIGLGYVQGTRNRPAPLGLTTEVALLLATLLGAAVTLGYRDLAIPLGVVVAAVLAYEQPLHGLVAKLGWTDVFAGLRLLLASFVVLPLLPDRTVDPWGALNPYVLWLLVILISSLSLVGYVATRWLGAERGTLLTGLTGGLVSSTAVTLAFARQAKDEPTAARALACGILVAWCVMFVRVVVAALAVNRDLLGLVVPSFALLALVTAALAWWFYPARALAAGGAATAQSVPLQNPFSLTAAVKFAALFAAVLLLVKLVQIYLPGRGVYGVAALAGLTDVDAITLSMADYARSNDPGTAVRAIMIASLTNTLVKCGMVVSLGGPALRRPVLLATAALLAAGGASFWLT